MAGLPQNLRHIKHVGEKDVPQEHKKHVLSSPKMSAVQAVSPVVSKRCL